MTATEQPDDFEDMLKIEPDLEKACVGQQEEQLHSNTDLPLQDENTNRADALLTEFSDKQDSCSGVPRPKCNSGPCYGQKFEISQNDTDLLTDKEQLQSMAQTQQDQELAEGEASYLVQTGAQSQSQQLWGQQQSSGAQQVAPDVKSEVKHERLSQECELCGIEVASVCNQCKEAAVQEVTVESQARLAAAEQDIAVSRAESAAHQARAQQLQQQMQNLQNSAYQQQKQLKEALGKIQQLQQQQNPSKRPKITRGARQTAFTDAPLSLSDEQLFPLLARSSSQEIAALLVSQISAEVTVLEKINSDRLKTQQNAQKITLELPSYKLLTLHALLFRLRLSASEARPENFVGDFLQLLLIDLNDDADFEKNKQINYAAVGDIKLLLACGKKEAAVQAALKAELYDLALYLAPENESVRDSYRIAFDKFIPGVLSDAGALKGSGPLHQLAKVLQEWESADFCQKVLQIPSNGDQKLLQILFIVAGVPLVYGTPFEYIKLYDKPRKTAQLFSAYLQKLSKQYKVPEAEELRYSEIYEYSFARQNAAFWRPRVQVQAFRERLEIRDEFGLERRESLGERLQWLSFFPHLSVFKAAVCGVARQSCQKDANLAFNVLMYLEHVARQLQYLIQYTQEGPGDEEDSDELRTIQVSELPFRVAKFALVFPCAAASQGQFAEMLRYVQSFRREIQRCGAVDYQEVLQEVDGSDVLSADEIRRFNGEELLQEISGIDQRSESDGLSLHEDLEELGDFSGAPAPAQRFSGQLFAGGPTLAAERPVRQEGLHGDAQNSPEKSSPSAEGHKVPSAHRQAPPALFAEKPFQQGVFFVPAVQEAPQEPKDQQAVRQEPPAVFQAVPFVPAAPCGFEALPGSAAGGLKGAEKADFFPGSPNPLDAENAPAVSDDEEENPFFGAPREALKNEAPKAVKSPKKQQKEEVVAVDLSKNCAKLSRKYSDKYGCWVKVDENGNEIPPEAAVAPPPPPAAGPLFAGTQMPASAGVPISSGAPVPMPAGVPMPVPVPVPMNDNPFSIVQAGQEPRPSAGKRQKQRYISGVQ